MQKYLNLTRFVNTVMSAKYTTRLIWAFKIYWTFLKPATCDEKQIAHTHTHTLLEVSDSSIFRTT